MKKLLVITLVFLSSLIVRAQYPPCDAVPFELVTSEISFTAAQFGGDSVLNIPIINQFDFGFAYPIARIEMTTPLPTGMSCDNCDWNVFGSSWTDNDTLLIDMIFDVTSPIPDNYMVTFDVIIMNLMGGGNMSYDTCIFQNPVTFNLNPVGTAGINEGSHTTKKLLKITDLTGRDTPYRPNTVLIYIYDDGSTEKVFIFEK